MSEIIDTEERNSNFRALCAVTELGDLEIPAWLRRDVLDPNNIIGGAAEITDEQIRDVFALMDEKFSFANILDILTQITQEQITTSSNLPVSANIAPLVGKIIQAKPDRKTLH